MVPGHWQLPVSASVHTPSRSRTAFFCIIQADVHHSFSDFSLMRHILFTYVDIKYTHSFNLQNRKLGHICFLQFTFYI